jgi:hypothetical protein
MSANTTYYARVPRITWEWIEVSALVAADVREQYPNATEVLHLIEKKLKKPERNGLGEIAGIYSKII